MSVPVIQLSAAQTDYWIRTNLAVELHVKESLLDVLHNTHNDPTYSGLPRGELQLYQDMSKFKLTHQTKLKKVLRQNQWDKLCPVSGKSDSVSWDITLIVVVIINDINLPPPQGGWKQQQPGDTSKAACVLLARWLRNETKHGSIHDIQTVAQFNVRWAKVKQTLVGLQYNINRMKEFDDLETAALKIYTLMTVKILEDKQLDLQQEVDDLKCKEAVDVVQLRTDLQNLNTLMIALETTKVSDDEFSSLVSTLNNLNNVFELEMNSLKNRQDELDNAVQELDKKISDVHVSNTSANTDFVLHEVLEIVVEMMNRNNWKVLSDLHRNSYKDKHFASKERKLNLLRKQNYDWTTLKNQLHQLNRSDIVEYIKQMSNVTTQFDQIVKNHQTELLNQFSQKKLTKPFLNPTGNTELTEKSEMETFVDLAILTGDDSERDNEEKLLGSSRDQDSNKEYVSIEAIIQQKDPHIFVRGIPGIGKSFLTRKIIVEWARGNILNGKSGTPYVRLLLPIICRELNTIKIQEGDTTEQILQQIFPDVFPMERLTKEMSKNFVFLIDGVDELQSIEKIADKQKPPLVNLLWDLATSPEFNKCKCIFVGRPKIIRKMQSTFEERTKGRVKKIIICGFSKESVIKYVHQEFDEQKLANEILKKFEVSPILDTMSRIPLYMWVLTGVFHYNPLSATPKTTTELLLYTYLLFIRSHHEKQGILKSQLDLMTLCGSPDVIESLKSIAQFSYTALKNNEIVFESDQDLMFLEEIGLLISFKRGEMGTRLYQFQHLVLQEFLAALHIFIERCLCKDVVIIDECFPLAAGLEGIYCGNVCGSESMLKVLLENIVVSFYSPEEPASEEPVKKVKPRSKISSFFKRRNPKQEAMQSKPLAKQQSIVSIQEEKLQNYRYNIGSNHGLLETFYENQATCDEVSLSKLTPGIISPSFDHPYELTHFTYFLTKAIQLCPDLQITTFHWSEETFNFDNDSIFALTQNCKTLKIHLSFIAQKKDGKSLANRLAEELLLTPSKVPSIVTIEECFENYKTVAAPEQLPGFVESLLPVINVLQSFEMKGIKERELPSVMTRTCDVIAKGMSTPLKLSELVLRNCALTDSELRPLVNILFKIKFVDIQQNELSQKTLYRILRDVQTVTRSSSYRVLKLIKLNFLGNKFTRLEDTETVQLKKHLKGESSHPFNFINNVDLGACYIPEKLMSEEFFDMLAQYTEKCNFNFNSLSDAEASMKYLAAVVRRHEKTDVIIE